MSSTNNWHTKIFILLIALLGVVLLVSLERSPATLAQGETEYIRQVRTFDKDNVGELSPVGLAFSPEANSFLVLEADNALTRITPVEDRMGSVYIGAAVSDPINSAFDSKFGRYLLIDSASDELIEIAAGAEGAMKPTTLRRHDVGYLGIGDAQGMAADAANGELFILDGAGPRVVRVKPGPDGGFGEAAASVVDLRKAGVAGARGIALDPASGHLYVYSGADQELVELTRSGQIVAGRDLSGFNLQAPQGMVIAPSGDQTDDAAQMSLYLADSEAGTIVEFSFVRPPELLRFRSLMSTPVMNRLVQSIDTSLWIPSSPDPAGIVYMPSTTSLPNSLLVSDSEVNENSACDPNPPSAPSHCFTGDNLFQSDLSGNLVSTLTTMNFLYNDPTDSHSDEPTGVTLNPANNHLFFSDDTGARRIYELDPGADGLYDTADDNVTESNTRNFGCPDVEGVTYASTSGALFIACGLNNEIYQVTPGANGVFDGAPPDGDDVATGFDTFGLGLINPEGIAYNPYTNHLYVVGDKPVPSDPDTLFEITTDGNVVQILDLSEATDGLEDSHTSGLAYGPSSENPAVNNIYIADRRHDNDKVENDGMVHEMTLPPLALDDSASTKEGEMVIIDVEANDREHVPNSANSTCSGGFTDCGGQTNGTLADNGDGTITYTPDPGFSGTDSFVYEICNIDGLCATATVTITVTTKVGAPPVANDDEASTQEGNAVTIDVASNDTDVDGNLDPNSANSTCANGSSGCVGAANGTLTDNGDGTITYTPDPGFSGSDSFVYEICDLDLLCDTATVSITVIPDTVIPDMSYVFIPLISR